MRKLLIAGAALLASFPALAQQGVPYFPQTIQAGQFLGRLSSGPGPVEAISTTAMLNALFPQNAAAFPFNAASVAFQGSVSGAVTVKGQAAAGTWTLQWPQTVGTNNGCLVETVSGSIATSFWQTCALLSGNNTFSGNNTHNGAETFNGLTNFASTFQKSGITQNFPASGNIVGTSDVQTITNKSIDAGQLTGTINAARLPNGVYASTVNTFTANHTIATTDCGNLVQMGTGSSGRMTVTLPSVSGFTGPCPIAIFNGNTTTVAAVFLSGFPSYCLNSRYYLFPGQAIDIQISNGAWNVTGCPGRYTPTAALTLLVNNSTGSDVDGDGWTKPFATINHCVDVMIDAIDYSSDFNQPTCGPQSGQTFTESVTYAIPPHGTNTLNITGQGGAFTWKPSGSNISSLVVGNYANIQVSNVNFSGTGTTCFSGTRAAGTACKLVSVHNVTIFETLSGVTCTDTGSQGDCISTDLNTAGGGRINIDSGLTVAGTIGNVINANSGTTVFWSSTLTASGTPAISQIFQGVGAGTNFFVAGNFSSSGTFGTARQWGIFNNATFCNQSSNAIPGSTAGVNSGAGVAAGVIVNSGTSATLC